MARSLKSGVTASVLVLRPTEGTISGEGLVARLPPRARRPMPEDGCQRTDVGVRMRGT